MVDERGYVKPALLRICRSYHTSLDCAPLECFLRSSQLGGFVMGNRRGVGRRRKADFDRHCDPPPDEMAPSRADQLDYIADMVQELKAMSARANYPALTELLQLAHQEAMRRRRAG